VESKRKRQAREATRRWRERNPEIVRERRKRWYEENKERIRAKAREYMRNRYATDPQRVRATNKAWYERNRERMREYDKRHRLANLQAIRAKDRERSRARYAADPTQGAVPIAAARCSSRSTTESHSPAAARIRSTTFSRRLAGAIDESTKGPKKNSASYCSANGVRDSSLASPVWTETLARRGPDRRSSCGEFHRETSLRRSRSHPPPAQHGPA
jgi:hypothetical protein